MPSPHCTIDRWGKGNCSTTPKTEEAKEMDIKLKKIMAERAKQDTMWTNNNTEKDK